MKNHWWKILGVLLLLYAIIVGIKVPLSPGIVNVSDAKARTGQSVKLDIEGYNSHFQSAEDVEAWLLFPNNKLLKAYNVKAVDECNLSAIFNIPNVISENDDKAVTVSVVVDNKTDGYLHDQDALSVIQLKSDDQYNSGLFEDLKTLNAVDNFRFPFRPIIYETIRNTFFHVAIWMAMFTLLIVSCIYSGMYLKTKNLIYDSRSSALTSVALYFGIAGLLTGSLWAKYAWGAFWTNDIKLNMTAISLLIYFSYWVLRSSIQDVDSRARLASVFNIFAFVNLMILVMVIPRTMDSLHPGNGGNPAFASEDLDNSLRMVFYPAIIGYTLIGLWMAQLSFRYQRLSDDIHIADFNAS